MIEVLVATAILSITSLSAFSSHVASGKLLESSRDSDLGMEVLRSAMDRLLLISVADLTDAAGTYPIGQAMNLGDGVLEDQTVVFTTPGFTPGDPTPAVLDLRLTLTWTDTGGRARTMTLMGAQR